MSKPKAYIASPMGFAESTRTWYDNTLLPTVSKYVEPLDPWTVDVTHILETDPTERPALWVELGMQHYQTIQEEADLVIAVLDQEPPDTGTVAEIAYAAAHNIPVIGYRSDIRTTGEEGLPYNLMVGAAIKMSGGIAVASLVELENELKQRYPRS